MAFNTDKLSYFHSFSKMPVQSGSNFADGTSLGNAINKSGHTVTSSEVWASDIPYYGAMGSLDDIKSKVQPYARKNDMCLVTTTGKTYIYDGEGNWSLVNADDATNAGVLKAGQLIKNANDEVVLLYHKGETLTNLTAANNANTNSANNAARLWTTIGKDGNACEKRLVEQFVGPTDKAINGLASVSYSPSIANGTLVAGTNYYDYCFSGTILWATARTTATVIDCFEYIGEKVSDVVDTVTTQGTAIQSVKDQVDTISDALGLGSEVVGTTLGSRVTDNETALRTLIGLEGDAKVVATESIATTAATVAGNAITTSLAATAEGTIGGAIKAVQDAVDAIDTGVASVTGPTTGLVTVSGEDVVTITVSDEIATKTYADTAAAGAVTTGLATNGNIAQAIATAKQSAIDSAKGYTDGEITTAKASIKEVTDALAGRIAALEGVKLSVQVVDALPTTPVVNTIYLVPEDGKTSGNYVEYIAYKPEGSETVTTERIGTTAVDLEGYTTDAEHTALADRVTALDAATTGRVAVVEGKVSTLEGQVSTLKNTTIPAVQQSVTDLTKTVGDNKTAIEKALADAKTEIGTTTSGLDTRLQTAEGKVSTLEGQVATITSTDATKEGSIAKALADAKTYAEGQASAAEAAAKSEASTNLSAAVEQIGKDIEAAKQAAISSSTVTLTQSATDTGILVTPNGTAANSFEIGIDKSIIATAASVSALSQTIASNKTELEGKITAAKEEISATTDALAADIQSIKDVIGEGGNGENIIDILSGIRTELTSTTATANSAAQSAEGDTYVSASQTDTKITVSTNIAAITSHVDTELVKSGTAVATAINAAQEAGVAAGNAASQALATAKTQTLEQTGTLNNMFTVKTTGSVGTGITAITITDAGLSKAISDAESNAVTTALGSTITSVTAKDVETSPKVTVTLSGTVQTPVLKVVTDDIASAKELAELKQTVTDKNVTTTTAAQTVGVTATGNAIDVATATYTPATADAAGSWSNEAKLVTGTDVKEAIADINSKIDTLHSAAVTYKVFATLPTAAAEHKGIVALVPANTGDSAVAGSYVEYLCVETVSGDTKTYAWQRIGTTAADFTQYAKSVTINGSKVSTATATGDINLGTVVTGITNSTQDLQNTGLVYGSIASDGKLTLGVASATTVNKGVVQLTDTVTASDSEKAVTGKAVAQAISTAVSDAELTFVNVRNGQAETENDLWGSSISEVDGVVTLTEGAEVKNPNMLEGETWGEAWNLSITKVEDNKAYTSAGFYANIQTENIKNGSFMFAYCENLASFDSKLTNLENGEHMFAETKLTTFDIDTPCLKQAGKMFYGCSNLSSFTRDLSNLTNGNCMFQQCSNLTTFSSDLSSLENGVWMFVRCTNLTTFTGDLSSLTDGDNMFGNCKLNTESLMFIADTINTVSSHSRIHIGIGNATPTEEEVEYLNEIHEKGWQVYVNGSKYTPAQASATTTLDENGQEVSTPIPFWAKPVEVTEEEAEYVGEDGKFYRILGGQFIFVSDPDTYGMFTCLEDAAANMRLTKIED